MKYIISLINERKKRELISWIGGGFVILTTGIWTLVTYVWPAGDPSTAGKGIVCAQQGGIAAGRDASHNTTINNGAAPQGANNTASCVEAGKN